MTLPTAFPDSPGRFGLALLLAAALPLAAAAQALGEIVVDAKRSGERIDVRAQVALDATPALVWEVITDYERLPQFVPGISASRVLWRSGDRLLLEQLGEARFLLFSFPIEVRLEVTESPPESIASRAVGGNLRHMSGLYEIHADAAGGAVVLRYSGSLEPDFALPPLLGLIAMRSMIEERFTAMAREIERRAAARRPVR